MTDQHSASATFQIPELGCAEEFALIERGLSRVGGVGALYPDYLQRRLRVEFDPNTVDAEQIASRLHGMGFPVKDQTTSADAVWSPIYSRNLTILTGGLLLFISATLAIAAGEVTPIVAVTAIASTICSGSFVALAGLRAVRNLRLDMNALMTIAAVGATGIADYFEAATAMFLFGIAQWLERFSMDRARHAVETLVTLEPDVAHLKIGDELRDVDPDTLDVGDVVLVKPGERLPVDGEVSGGFSAVDEAPITGESIPAEKSDGDRVFAGSLNGEGSLEIRATRTAASTTLARIARLVDEAQATRAPTQRFVDAFARRYTPAVILLAVLVAVLPPALAWAGVWQSSLSGSALISDWLHRGLVLLVVACPCALVISTPVTIVCGLRQAARCGILIKGGEHLESAAVIDSIALDKTGTLTTGQPSVEQVVPLGRHTEEEVLRIAAMLEIHSEHPVAAAIAGAATARGIEFRPAEKFEAIRGFGICGSDDGKQYFVGSERLFIEEGLIEEADRRDVVDRIRQSAGSRASVWVGKRGQIIGALVISDEPRREAAEAIDELKRLGIRPVVMLTGDHQEIADRIAEKTGIDEVHAELLPQDKVESVRRLAQQHPHLAMVGDGVNDAPALAAARLGIAMGAQSSATALETADVVIMSPVLTRIGQLVRLGRRCRTILQQNIALSLSIKGVVLVLAAVNLATMWMAVAADVGTSMIVIANGMRLIERAPQANVDEEV